MTTCSKILSKTDTSKALSLPTKFFKYSLPSFNGGHAVSFKAKDESGFDWTFKCSTRKNFKCSTRKKGHPKPVLSKGWLAFVRNKKLKVGDKITFSVLDPTAAVPSYGVRAEKVQAEKVQAENVQPSYGVRAEKVQAEKVQAENVQADKVQEDKVQAEKVQAENDQAEKVQEEKVQAEKVQAENVQAEKVQAENVQAEKVQAVKEVKIFGAIFGYSPIIAPSIP
ncbi:hypothetical protein OIU79_029815 [Salix purpurea]|uniref:TF-B3 domain-containing protein n=1 Tax=Salix purpurea TaxID=77065 RepID=A0A9Q0VI39_SALPP|nr:hypothetical protein OIU79_029815 [Salix purpurea]